MSGLTQTIRSSIGAKTVMALTGLALLLFVVGHLVGNLQIFVGRQEINDYAELLKSSVPLLWSARIGLLILLAAHVDSAIRVTRQSLAARPIAYKVSQSQRSTYASRNMLMTGLIVLAYVVFHLLHFTLGVIQPEAYALVERVGEQQRADVYGMMIAGFQNAWIVLSYVLAQGLLALHLSHGLSSAFQTLGVTHPRLCFLKGWFGPVAASLIFVGYVSIPISVLLGIVG